VSIVSRCQKKNAQPHDASITSKHVENKTNRHILFFDTIEVLFDKNVRLVVPPSWLGEEDFIGLHPNNKCPTSPIKENNYVFGRLDREANCKWVKVS